MQIEVVSVRFRHSYSNYYFSPNGLNLEVGQYVIVDTERDKDIAKVVKGVETINAANLTEPLKNVIRIASEKEIKEGEENDKKAQSLLPQIKKIALEKGLEMKIVSVESNYNFTRLVISFTADGRVDFRDLVKALAEKYKVRIELRQIGPREATRILGGIGPCGKECCCKQGVDVNDHVSIKMAKNQDLSLNPNAISGLCGKLLCCLSYENGYYVEMLKVMPKINAVVKTPDGEGKVVYRDLIKKTVDVKFTTESSSEIKKYDLDKIKFKREEQ